MALVLITAMLLTIMAPAYAARAPIGRAISISSFTDLSGSINIDVGKGERVTVGAKGVIVRDGKQIGEYQVVQVNWGFSRIQVLNLADGITVQPGDSAPITVTPAVKKSSKSKTLWIAVAAAVVVVLLFGKHKSSSSPSGATVSLTADKVSNADKSSTVTITARVTKSDGEAAPDGTAITFTSTAGRLDHSQTTTNAGRAIAVLTYDSFETANTATVTATVKTESLSGTSTITIPITMSMEIAKSADTIQVVNGGGTGITTSTITATCQDAAGLPATSGKVEFAASIGTVLPDSVEIGATGVATATFSSDTSGEAIITATWNGSTVTTTITVTAGPPYSIAVSSSAASVQANGTSFAKITATVTDVSGNLATDGTVVNFSVIPDGSGGGNGTIASTATTTNGVATANLYTRDSASAASKAGTATVSAEVRIAGQPSTVPAPAMDLENHSATVQFVSPTAGPPYSIAVSSDTASIQADGNSFARITATVTDVIGDLATNGTVVNFSVIPDGAGGGNGTIAATATTTNGVATANLYSRVSGGARSNPGMATISAEVRIASQPSTVPAPAINLENHSATVQFVSPDVATIGLSASPTNVRGWDKISNKTTITAAVKNTSGQPVPNGTAVTFSASHGLVNGISTTTNGIATATLVTDASGGDGHVDVTATAGGVTVTQTHLVIFSGPPSPTRCDAVLSLDTIPAVGGLATISISALDLNDHPVADGTSVTVNTDKGSLSASGRGTLTGGHITFILSTSTDPLTPTPVGTGTVRVSIDSGGTNAETGGQPVIIEKTFTVTAVP